MKRLLFFLLTLILSFSMYSQTNEISFEPFYFQYDGDYYYSANGSYFRNFSSKSSIGTMIHLGRFVPSYRQDEQNKNGEKDFNVMLNLLYRKTILAKGNSTLYVGGGASFATVITYYKKIPVYLYCGNGPYYEPKQEKHHWNYDYFAGVTISANYQYSITGNIFAGVNIYGMYCYEFSYEEWTPGILPVLQFGYKW